jgi:hypothetical protein
MNVIKEALQAISEKSHQTNCEVHYDMPCDCHVGIAQRAIPAAEAVEKAIDAAIKVANRWESDGLSNDISDRKLIDDMCAALTAYKAS